MSPVGTRPPAPSTLNPSTRPGSARSILIILRVSGGRKCGCDPATPFSSLQRISSRIAPMIDHSMIQSCKFPDGALAGSLLLASLPLRSVPRCCLSHSCSNFLFSVLPVFGGGGGIRTPGSSRFNGFQDRRIRPLCHPSGMGLLNQLAGREGFEPQQTVLETVALPIELPSYSGINPPAGRLLSPPPRAKGLLDDLGHLTGADRAATLADSEVKPASMATACPTQPRRSRCHPASPSRCLPAESTNRSRQSYGSRTADGSW